MLVSSNPFCRFDIQPPARFALVDRFYRSQGYRVRCVANERVYSLSIEKEGFVAAVRLVPQESGVYWLRNLLVKDTLRRRGLAALLMRHVLADLTPQACCCFALPHLKNFYENLGFVAEPLDCPQDLAEKFHAYRPHDWVLMVFPQAPLM